MPIQIVKRTTRNVTVSLCRLPSCVSEVYTYLDISNLLTFGVAAPGAPLLALCIVCNMNSLEYDE